MAGNEMQNRNQGPVFYAPANPTVPISRNFLIAILVIAFFACCILSLILGYVAGKQGGTHNGEVSQGNSVSHIPSSADMDRLNKAIAQNNGACGLMWAGTQNTYQVVCTASK